MAVGTIYKLKNKGYLIFGTARTVSGFRVGQEPFIRIREDHTGINVITNAIKEVLSADDSRRVPDPKNWNEFDNIFLQQAGLKSLKELHKSTTTNIGIALTGDNIIFTPTRHAEKPDEGFLHKSKEEAVTISYSATAEEIMSALELAFNRCE